MELTKEEQKQYEKIVNDPSYKIFEALKGYEIPSDIIKIEKWKELEALQKDPKMKKFLKIRRIEAKLADLEELSVADYKVRQKSYNIPKLKKLFGELVENKRSGKYKLAPAGVYKCLRKCYICKDELCGENFKFTGPGIDCKIELITIHYLLEHDVFLCGLTNTKLNPEDFAEI